MSFLTDVVAVKKGHTVVTIDDGESKKGRWVNYEDDDNILSIVLDALDDGHKVYLTPAVFSQKRRLLQAASLWRAVWIDIDAGPIKHAKRPTETYTTQEEAKAALLKTIEASGLDVPSYIISSGDGLHVYWCFEVEMGYQEWRAVAGGLVAICTKHGLLFDRAVTVNGVTLMRMPGSLNARGQLAHVIFTGEQSSEEMRQTLLHANTSIVGSNKSKQISVTKGAFAEMYVQPELAPTADFFQAASACGQLQHAIENASNLAEPLWRAVLSVAHCCVNRKEGIEAVSVGHPDYTWEASDHKAASTAGPFTCNTFNLINPSLCSKCPHYGKVTSPIVLGKPQRVEGEVIKEGPADIFMPAGFSIKNGKIYRELQDDVDGDVKSKWIFVSPFVCYVSHRYTGDADEGGNLYILKSHFPNDGVKETIIRPGVVFQSIQSFTKTMCSFDIVLTSEQMPHMKSYLQAQVQHLIERQKLGNKHEQFGWVSEDTFILGDQELSRIADKPIQLSGDMQIIGNSLAPKGTVAEWVDFVDKGYNYKGNHAHQFAIIAGFGSVLMRLENMAGGVIHLYNDMSGTGKTTAQEIACSIWGDPEKLLNTNSDTQAALYHKRGLFNSLPFAVNEVTVWDHPRIAEFIYNSTNAKGKDRMRSQSNALRENKTSWDGYTITSGNVNLSSLIATKVTASGGMLMRVLSIPMHYPTTPMTPAMSHAHFQKRTHYYGTAGRVFIKDILENVDEYKKMLEMIRTHLIDKAQLGAQHRYWASIVACVIVAGYQSQALGLHRFDMSAILDWAIHLLRSEAREATVYQSSEAGMLVKFILNNIDSILFVGHDGTPKGGRMPQRSIKMRIDAKTNTFSFTSDAFNKFCADETFHSKRVFDLLKSTPGCVLKSVRLAAGTGLPSVASYGVSMDMNNKAVKELIGDSLATVGADVDDVEDTL